MEGLVTFERAKNVYGVVLTQNDKENPETITIDYPATQELRRKLKASK
jgi:hypothetical protein